MKDNNVSNYQKEADKIVKEIYSSALQSKVINNTQVMLQDLLNKTLEYRTWKSYYKKFKKYLASNTIDIKTACDFALGLNCAKVSGNQTELAELNEIRTYLGEFVNLLEGFKNNTDSKMLRIISCLDLNMVYNNIVQNIKNTGITRN